MEDSTRTDAVEVTGPAFAIVPAQFILGKHTLAERAVFTALCFHANRHHESRPSLKTIAAESGVSKRHTQTTLATLEAQGWITAARQRVAHDRNEVNRYDLSLAFGVVGELTSPRGGGTEIPTWGNSLPPNKGSEHKPLNPSVPLTLVEPPEPKVKPADVLRAWNEIFAPPRGYRGEKWTKGIAACIAAYPEITLAEFRALVAAEHATRWWERTGQPARPVTPGLIFGSVGQFERCLNREQQATLTVRQELAAIRAAQAEERRDGRNGRDRQDARAPGERLPEDQAVADEPDGGRRVDELTTDVLRRHRL